MAGRKQWRISEMGTLQEKRHEKIMKLTDELGGMPNCEAAITCLGNILNIKQLSDSEKHKINEVIELLNKIPEPKQMMKLKSEIKSTKEKYVKTENNDDHRSYSKIIMQQMKFRIEKERCDKISAVPNVLDEVHRREEIDKINTVARKLTAEVEYGYEISIQKTDVKDQPKYDMLLSALSNDSIKYTSEIAKIVNCSPKTAKIALLKLVSEGKVMRLKWDRWQTVGDDI